LSFFRHFISTLGSVFNQVFSRETLNTLEVFAIESEKYLPDALRAVNIINALAPNRTTEELAALGARYQLHVTPEILADPHQVETLLQNAALKEVQAFAPHVKSSLLRNAIEFGVQLAKAEREKAATA
jgi:hypothetical protein